ncbi:hypothetical protein YC2023_117622 [Brassica napus]|uniref:C3H1-type domain-containing protein n=1 Tax=Brassica oleracea TaxID=3712 RepID=A0A3P6E8S4_BRAOL|nr:unnamed protein product [Brassica oleracea]
MDFNLNGGNKRVFDRLGGSNRPAAAAKGSRQEVWSYWRAGRCNRNPCQFLHRELPGPVPSQVIRTKGSLTNLGLRVRVAGEDPDLTGTLVIPGGGSVGTGR